MLNPKHQLFWTLEDYHRFIQHPDQLVRKWASYRIEAQYPERTVELFQNLLMDENRFLRIKAAQAIGETKDVRFEDKLLATLPGSDGMVRREIISALGQINSPEYLPVLIQMIDAADTTQELPKDYDGVVHALSRYTELDATNALWRFVEHYHFDDHHSNEAYRGLLLHPQPDTIHRLLIHYYRRKPVHRLIWNKGLDIFADVAGVRRLAEDIHYALVRKRPEEILDISHSWIGFPIPVTDEFYKALRPRFRRVPKNLVRLVYDEISSLMNRFQPQTDQWIADWQQGNTPVGFRWRTLCTFQTITELARVESKLTETQKLEAGALCLALMAQTSVDEDDEMALSSAQTEEAREAALLNNLGSPRQNVMQDIYSKVVELGPHVFPQLIEMLGDSYTDDIFWPMLRILETLTVFTRKYHPAYDEDSITLIMDILMEDLGDFTNEACHDLLVAIGPPMVEHVAKRLGEKSHFDIYASGALAEIPTEASLEASLSLIESEEIWEGDLEKYMDYGHPRIFDLYKEVYDEGPLERSLKSVIPEGLYTICLLNDMHPPELETWKTMAYKAETEFENLIENFAFPDEFLESFSEEDEDDIGLPYDKSKIEDIVHDVMSRSEEDFDEEEVGFDNVIPDYDTSVYPSPHTKHDNRKEKHKRKQAKAQRKQQRKQKKKKR